MGVRMLLTAGRLPHLDNLQKLALGFVVLFKLENGLRHPILSRNGTFMVAALEYLPSVG